MWRLYIVYDSDKRYLVPFEIVEKYVDEQTIAKIKKAALREIQKL